MDKIQRPVTKLPPNSRELSYKERLQILDLTRLEQRREKGDLKAMYRMMKGLEKQDRENLTN